MNLPTAVLANNDENESDVWTDPTPVDDPAL